MQSVPRDMAPGLDAHEIVATVDRLTRRIRERFPDAHLVTVSEQLAETVREAKRRIDTLARPFWAVRLVSGVLILAVVVIVATALTLVPLSTGPLGLADLIQTLEAAVNDVIFLGVAVFFLFTIERRMKRRRALAAVHELRSLAHLVDLHQLTKDPERTLGLGQRTPSSPRSELTPFELGRYLDYCSEMLSLIGVTAALYVEKSDDPVVLSAASEVQSVAASLSQKIWQKILVLRSLQDWHSNSEPTPARQP